MTPGVSIPVQSLSMQLSSTGLVKLELFIIESNTRSHCRTFPVKERSFMATLSIAMRRPSHFLAKIAAFQMVFLSDK